jgi:hypothetical protein
MTTLNSRDLKSRRSSAEPIDVERAAAEPNGGAADAGSPLCGESEVGGAERLSLKPVCWQSEDRP